MVYTPEKPIISRGLTPVTEENFARLEPVIGVNRQIRSSPRMTQMLEQVIKTAQKTLNITAASLLLFGENEEELFFEVACGPVGKTLKQVKLSTRYGIAGQVARTGKPLIVNDVSRSERFHKMIDDTTGFQTKSLICAPLMVQHKILGVMEALNKLDGSDFGEADLEAVVAMATTTAMAIENTRQYHTIQDAFKNTISTLAAVVDAKDPYACGHSQRVMEYTSMAAAYFSIAQEELEVLRHGAVLHDIGKIEIDSAILAKVSPLTQMEWEIVRKHPVTGANMLKGIPFLEKAAELALCHHERFDGTGYPRGLKGEGIPLGARLISIADAFDTMTTGRAYHPAMPMDHAVKELQVCAGSQFCPVAVTAFVSGLHVHTRAISSGFLHI
ncbi:MAG TPA: HD domain-containing phosphohydrolase [Dehalococcoidales bacterium]|nr:HD domain-containing phosphohydrolase [Dehalococcoidales bacterium]